MLVLRKDTVAHLKDTAAHLKAMADHPKAMADRLKDHHQGTDRRASLKASLHSAHRRLDYPLGHPQGMLAMEDHRWVKALALHQEHRQDYHQVPRHPFLLRDSERHPPAHLRTSSLVTLHLRLVASLECRTDARVKRCGLHGT